MRGAEVASRRNATGALCPTRIIVHNVINYILCMQLFVGAWRILLLRFAVFPVSEGIFVLDRAVSPLQVCVHLCVQIGCVICVCMCVLCVCVYMCIGKGHLVADILYVPVNKTCICECVRTCVSNHVHGER